MNTKSKRANAGQYENNILRRTPRGTKICLRGRVYQDAGTWKTTNFLRGKDYLSAGEWVNYWCWIPKSDNVEDEENDYK